MKDKIRVLDCTLRDGGHINQGIFGEKVIKTVIKRLIESKVDIIELGFLWGEINDIDTARFASISDAKRILPKEKSGTKYSLMADSVDLSNLEENDGTIDYIRISFKKRKMEWAFETAQILREKGYKFFMNPIYSNTYSDYEYLELIKRINEMNPYGFSIVDTYGTMRIRDLERRVYLVDHNLDSNIVLGLHLHENLGLAYCLAQHFLKIVNPAREVIVDSSLLGMGRVPGNLRTEQIVDYLNSEYGYTYQNEPILDAIDDCIAPIKEKHTWSCSIPYFVSAMNNLPRSYAEYLMGKSRLKNKDIQRILKRVSIEKSQEYDEEYIEELYLEYMNVNYDSSQGFKNIRKLIGDKKVLVIAPGMTISTYRKKISEYIQKNNPVVIAVNFLPVMFKTDIVFCTNVKRYEDILDKKRKEHLVVTSNILHDYEEYDSVVAYKDAVYNKGEFCDDSTMMLINVLEKSGINEIVIAGFDGVINKEYSFYDDSFKPNRLNIVDNEKINKFLELLYSNFVIEYLTPSAHNDRKKE